MIFKILVGSSDDRMRIWNLRSGKLVHEFDSLEDDKISILVLEQSPAIDVIGVGMSNGKISLKNIKFDTLICSFRQTGKITALAFRLVNNFIVFPTGLVRILVQKI